MAETLKKASKRILAKSIDGLRDVIKDDDLFIFYKNVVLIYGEEMAKWQEEQSKQQLSKSNEKLNKLLSCSYCGSIDIRKD